MPRPKKRTQTIKEVEEIEAESQKETGRSNRRGGGGVRGNRGKGRGRGKATTDIEPSVSTTDINGSSSINERTESIKPAKGGRGKGRGRRKTSVEPSVPIIDINDSSSTNERTERLKAVTTFSDDALEETSSNRVFNLIVPNNLDILEKSKVAKKKIAEVKSQEQRESHVSSYESMNSLDNVTALLQVTDSEDDNDDKTCRYEFYEKRKKNQKRQRADMNEDSDSNEVAESSRKRTEKPKIFKDMKTCFEVCQWLVLERPDVLSMANQMRDSMNISLDLPATVIHQPTIASNNNVEDKGLARLWHEEIKCLFLRCRNPPDGTIENLIANIFDYELYSNEAVEIICHSKRVLTDFRSKFNKNIASLVDEFKNKRSREGQISAPSRTEIDEFITHVVAKQVLKRYLNGTNVDRLIKCGTMDKLETLIKEAFKICYNNYDIQAVKKLDDLTIDCKVPSKSGKAY
ncbi:hypothetical protein RhiirA5_380096 [Rhizophagus irregularis]|uniref:Uncharacterized protein n=1 Tax=Rhizophagus irregularis TaxID=588596 RepID=A0A2N0P9N6_9GLOM|nr:hypothetical protein RhiirA5_380096 [Rhizophagus irregularis]